MVTVVLIILLMAVLGAWRLALARSSSPRNRHREASEAMARAAERARGPDQP
jgi:hypothetical protein